MWRFVLILGLSVCLVAGIPKPEDEEYEDEYEDVCLTSADSEDPEKECIFPFTFNNFTYHGCPTDPVDETKRWCSTKTDENGNHITGDANWGHCTSGCNPEVFPDELLIGTDANNDTQTDTCDYTACNGFTFKLDVFDKVETYGQCQFPAGENGATDDYFCFVNADSACEDKVPYGDEEEGLFVTTLACKDPNTPLPRGFGFYESFRRGFYGSSRHGRSYGNCRYCNGGYKGSNHHHGSSHGSSHHGSSHGSSYGSSYGSSHHQKQKCHTTYKEHCTYKEKQECEHTYKTVTTYEDKEECKTVYKTVYRKKQECHTTYTEECKHHDHHGSSGGYDDYDYGHDNHGSSYGGSKCKKIPHKDCKYVDVPGQVPDKQCHYVKVPVKSHVPDKKCHYVKVPHCHKVPEKKCHTSYSKPRRRYGHSYSSSSYGSSYVKPW